MSADVDVVRLERWAGPWDDDDPDAGFKAEVAEYTRLDPLTTLQGLAQHSGIPVGALARYVLVKWCAAGSEGLLELGPTMVERLWACVAEAEQKGTDADRLAAYHALKDLLGWLRAGLA
jgi:hypothetical protein